MSGQLNRFRTWATAHLPRGYKLPVPMIERMLESGLKDMPPELIKQLRSNKGDLVYLHTLQTALLSLPSLLKGDFKTYQSITMIRGIQFARTLDLTALEKNPGKVLANPRKYFHPERLLWGWRLAGIKGRPGRDRVKFLLLLNPYRKLIEEEVASKLKTKLKTLPRMAPMERAKKVDKIKEKCLASTRNNILRAWKDFSKELPEEIVALLLVVQFFMWAED